MSEWKEGVVRPAMRGSVSGHFGIWSNDGVYSVTHLATGFKAHQCGSFAEAKAVGEAMNELEGWELVQLDPSEAMKVIGMSAEMSAKATGAKERAIGPAEVPTLTQATL